jgi:hypothetical protein
MVQTPPHLMNPREMISVKVCPHIPFMVFNGLHPNDIEFKSMCDKMLENRKNKKMGKVK